jgi:hypothetical protein
MDDNNRTPPPEPDDDLLDWMPPELVERARQTAERDAGAAPPRAKRRRADYTKPPGGRRPLFSLAALAGGALLLAVGTALSATGARGAQGLAEKGRPGFALWLAGQSATLCVYLFCLLPLGRRARRPALAAALGAGLALSLAASLAAMLRGGRGKGIELLSVAFAALLTMAFSPNLWLILGMLRRRTTEKFSALMGSANLAVGLVGLIAALAGHKADRSTAFTALSLAQGLCYLALLASWPVLDRAVLPVQKGTADDGQPE